MFHTSRRRRGKLPEAHSSDKTFLVSQSHQELDHRQHSTGAAFRPEGQSPQDRPGTRELDRRLRDHIGMSARALRSGATPLLDGFSPKRRLPQSPLWAPSGLSQLPHKCPLANQHTPQPREAFLATSLRTTPKPSRFRTRRQLLPQFIPARIAPPGSMRSRSPR